MKMICDRTLLANAVAGVSKAVTQRSSIPVLEGILMKAEGFSLTLTGYDLEMGITTSIEANVLEPGEVVLSAKLLGDMVRRLSSSEVEITATETNASAFSSSMRFSPSPQRLSARETHCTFPQTICLPKTCPLQRWLRRMPKFP